MKAKAAWIGTILVAVAISYLIAGCDSSNTEQREAGCAQISAAFQMTDRTPSLFREVETGPITITVHSEFNGGLITPTDTGYHIDIEGRQTEAGIIVDWAVLGHELAHAIADRDRSFLNPDLYKQKGF